MQPTKDFPAPTDEAAYWACVGFRHDFGLLPDADAQRVRAEGLAWLAAWRTGFADGHESAGADGLGDDWDEPFAKTIEAACLTFDPGFRTRPFHEASAIRRGGVEWLQAWRKAVEDQGLKNRTPSAGLADPIERGLKAVDGALQIVGELQAMLDHPQRPVIADADEEPFDEAIVAFFGIVSAGVREANRAILKFPAPNYTITKFAEEAGEFVKAAVHCAEGRESMEAVRAEMTQAVAMLFRLWVEGDQVHGLPPIFTAPSAGGA